MSVRCLYARWFYILMCNQQTVIGPVEHFTAHSNILCYCVNGEYKTATNTKSQQSLVLCARKKG